MLLAGNVQAQSDIRQLLGFIPINKNAGTLQHGIRLPEGLRLRILKTVADDEIPRQPDMNVLAPSGRFLFTSYEIFDADKARHSTSLTRLDLSTGKVVQLVKGLQAADGLKWTPWDNLLLGEEYPDGQIWEISPYSGKATPRPALGVFSHEGIAISPAGIVYLCDEHEQGAIYRFVPHSPLQQNSLAKGQLQVFTDDRGWLNINNPADARDEASAVNAAYFDRPEDMEIGPDGRIYIAVTGEHRVMVLDDSKLQPSVSEYISSKDALPDGKLRWPDNLAFDPAGRLYITEDIPFLSRVSQIGRNGVWVALPDQDNDGRSDGVYRFAEWSSGSVEPTGLEFSQDGRRLYINSMGSFGPGRGAIMVIEGFTGRQQSR